MEETGGHKTVRQCPSPTSAISQKAGDNQKRRKKEGGITKGKRDGRERGERGKKEDAVNRCGEGAHKNKKDSEKQESDLTKTIPGVLSALFVYVCNEHSRPVKRSY